MNANAKPIERRVLLVDDDSVSRMSVGRMLKKSCITAHLEQAADGVEALELIDNDQRRGVLPPEIIFLDVNMPRMGGIEFLSKLKETELIGPDPLVVMMLTVPLSDEEEGHAVGIWPALKFFSKSLTEIPMQDYLAE